jgi:hypothetical protein
MLTVASSRVNTDSVDEREGLLTRETCRSIERFFARNLPVSASVYCIMIEARSISTTMHLPDAAQFKCLFITK